MKQVIVILSLACLVLGFMQWRSCHKAPDKSIVYDHQVDSINTVLKVHDSANLQRIVEAEIAADQYKSSRDSALEIIADTKYQLKGKDKDISALVDQINQAEQNKDTALIIEGCDSLKKAYPEARALVTFYIRQNDSLQAINSHIITQKDTIIGRLNQMFTETNNSLFETSRIYSNLSTDYKALMKKNSRRFVFGPTLSVGYVNGKISVVPGLGLAYTLLKF